MSRYMEFGRLAYDTVTGDLIWRNPNSNVRKPGEVAGGIQRINGKVYKTIRLGGKLYLQHRLIFFLVNKRWPVGIDHIDGDGTNNTLCNIREATQSQNNMNYKRRCDNTSGCRGVYKKGSKWFVRVVFGGKRHELHGFKCTTSAISARNKLYEEIAGEYAWRDI